ncbi:MAG: DNA-binding protein [Bacilli bacterium]|nr:DNA-binding protein [Bacilli bacterium]
MEKKVEISILLEIYGKLLTEKQYEYMNSYYNEDLSLSEIAENEEITRQAVMRILQKSSKKLEEYEQKLQIMEKQKKIKKYIKNKEFDEIENLLNI